MTDPIVSMPESMPTVREALALPVFAGARLVAGTAGLDNPIRWVHIVDIPDAHYEWQRRGVLLLTAGYGLRDNPERQATLVPKLVEEGFAGLVLSVGYYFDEVPTVIRTAADELGFPVIEAPRSMLFIEVTEAVLERIVRRQYRLLEQAAEISARLTAQVLEGANLEGLASTLARLIGRSVTIEDAAFRVVADAQVGPIDEARRQTLARGRSSPELAQHLLDAGIYATLQEQLGPIYLPPMPQLGMTLERLVAPIVVDREIYGFIWILIDSSPPSELDSRAIAHAATVAALILFKDKAVRRAEDALRGDFLEQLLVGPDDAVLDGEEARRLRFRADRCHQVLVVVPRLSSGGTERSLLPAIESWLEAQRTPVLSAWRGPHLVLVVESDSNEASTALAQALVRAFSHPGSRLLVGVGGVCPPESLRERGLRPSLDQAHEAVRIAVAGGTQEGVAVFDDLGLLHWLYYLPADVLAGNRYLAVVARLDAYDRDRSADLLKTLEVYLEQNGSLVETAERLYIHRNTLLHRLERVRQISGLELRTARERLNIHAAILAYRLRRAPGDGR